MNKVKVRISQTENKRRRNMECQNMLKLENQIGKRGWEKDGKKKGKTWRTSLNGVEILLSAESLHLLRQLSDIGALFNTKTDKKRKHTRWELMRIDENWWELMRMDENWWDTEIPFWLGQRRLKHCCIPPKSSAVQWNRLMLCDPADVGSDQVWAILANTFSRVPTKSETWQTKHRKCHHDSWFVLPTSFSLIIRAVEALESVSSQKQVWCKEPQLNWQQQLSSIKRTWKSAHLCNLSPNFHPMAVQPWSVPN